MYYLISIQKLLDGTQPASLLGYNDEKSAISAYHATLASNYVNDNLTYFCVIILTEQGTIRMQECWYKPEEPEE